MVAPEKVEIFLLEIMTILVATGPDIAFVIASGISAGRRGGVVAAFGITVGVSMHVALAALGTGTSLRA
jgi:threonine/homoserine/homoserine lactone efflux protein